MSIISQFFQKRLCWRGEAVGVRAVLSLSAGMVVTCFIFIHPAVLYFVYFSAYILL